MPFITVRHLLTMLMKQLMFLTVLLVLNSKNGQCHKIDVRTTAMDASGCQGKLDLAKFSKGTIHKLRRQERGRRRGWSNAYVTT